MGLRFVMEEDDERFVYWLEKRGRGTLPAGHADRCRRHRLREAVRSVETAVLTSATLAVAGGFDSRAEAAGPAATRAHWWCPATSITRSRRCSMFRSTCPSRAVRRSPRAPRRRWSRILEHSRGPRLRALHQLPADAAGATTSVSLEIEYPTLMQGTGPRSALLDEFRATPNCVLFATSSFWQGVDVPGEQLSCVIIDKLPFAVPSDPVVNARIESIRSSGGQSVLRLPDPAGRHRAETGIRAADSQPGPIAACWCCWITGSPRQRYGQVFFDSLPDYGFTTRLQDVEKFFNV